MEVRQRTSPRHRAAGADRTLKLSATASGYARVDHPPSDGRPAPSDGRPAPSLLPARGIRNAD